MNSVLVNSKWGRMLMKKLMKPVQKYKPMPKIERWNIVRGDLVRVIQGPQAGQQGKVMKVIRQQNRLIIEGVNMRRRIIKPTMDGTPGRIIIRPCVVHYSNCQLIDPSTGEPTKISRKFLEDGTKVRVARKTGTIVPKPDLEADRRPRSLAKGPKDTEPQDVFEVTFSEYEKYLPYIYSKYRHQLNNNNNHNNNSRITGK